MQKILLLFVLLTSVLFAAGCTKKEKQPDPVVIEEDISKEVPEETVDPNLVQTSEKTEKFEFSASYPKSIQAYPILEQAVLKEISRLQTQFQDWRDEVLEDDIETASFPWQLSINFGEALHTDDVISLFGVSYDYTGGAHGNSSFVSFVYDKEAQRILQLQDLFSDTGKALEAISQYVRNDLRERLGTVNEEWFLDGTNPTTKNYENFTLVSSQENGSVDGIGIHFPPYQVASYADGEQHVFVPASVFAEFISAEFKE